MMVSDEVEGFPALCREVAFVVALRDGSGLTEGGGGAFTPACRAEERVGLDLGTELLFLIQYPPA